MDTDLKSGKSCADFPLPLFPLSCCSEKKERAAEMSLAYEKKTGAKISITDEDPTARVKGCTINKPFFILKGTPPNLPLSSCVSSDTNSPERVVYSLVELAIKMTARFGQYCDAIWSLGCDLN